MPAGEIDSIMVATDFHAFQVNAALRMIGKNPGEDVLVEIDVIALAARRSIIVVCIDQAETVTL